MDRNKLLNIEVGKAICYSGFREGQSPESGNFPTYEQVKEDLFLLKKDWKYLRLYDCDRQSDMVLEIISKEKLDFKVMLGAYIGAEVNNTACAWGGSYSDEELSANKERNLEQIQKLIQIANQYPDIVFSLSAGNEALVDWTDHYVPIESVIDYVRMLKKGAKQPVTFCENYLPWLHHLSKLVDEVDFISIHTYPVWEYKNIDEALEYTKQNYYSVADKYPHKAVVITEAGWATNSNGRGIDTANANEDLQEMYYHDLMKWTMDDEVLTFYFEAFDEPWKGSNDALEPEKHWGLYTVDRQAKKAIKNLYANKIQTQS